MPTFDANFDFQSSPFERYVAEREPNISDYAVKPPYFEEARRRIENLSSYILFGFRGSGKSATRLTAEKETWGEMQAGAARPLLVSFTDFDAILRNRSLSELTDYDLVRQSAFLTIEAMLLWMSNQPEGERFVEMLNEAEYSNLASLARVFYLSEPAESRAVSQSETMKLLQQAGATSPPFGLIKNGQQFSRLWAHLSLASGLLNLELAIFPRRYLICSTEAKVANPVVS